MELKTAIDNVKQAKVLLSDANNIMSANVSQLKNIESENAKLRHEIFDKHMELPLGADGVPIRLGDWDVALLLADLIDRPTCRNVYDENEMGSCINGFECSECGNTVEDYEGYRVSGEFNYCSKCGAVVVSDDD